MRASASSLTIPCVVQPLQLDPQSLWVSPRLASPRLASAAAVPVASSLLASPYVTGCTPSLLCIPAPQVEFNQCQAQLAQLYEEGLGSKEGEREFTAYSILYNVGKGAFNNVNDLMLSLVDEDYQDSYIGFACAVRAAEALGDYTRLFRLYACAPGHTAYVMDTFIDRVRLTPSDYPQGRDASLVTQRPLPKLQRLPRIPLHTTL